MTAAQAAETVGTAVTAEDLSFEGCAENIKRIYKERYPEQAEMIEEIVDIISADEQFVYIFEQEGASAFQVVENSLIDALTPGISSCMVTDELYITKYLVAPVKQIYTDFCGPASAVMALVGSGASGYYYTENESINNDWQKNVANMMPQTKGHAAVVYELRDLMRNAIPERNGYKYEYEPVTKYSYRKAIDFLEYSLIEDAVPIIQVPDTQYFNYYGKNNSFKHYVAVTCVDILAEAITVVDPHYNDNYFGVNIISFKEFEEMIQKSLDSEGNPATTWIIAYSKQ